MSASEIVVVGQIARDLVLVVDQVPDAGATVDVRRRRELLGGKGANIAVGLAQLGASAAVVGVVGDDQVGRNLLDQAGRDGLDTSAVQRRAGCESALMVDIVTPGGQWRYLESVPEGTLLTAEDVACATDVLQSTDTLILQLQQPADAIIAALDRIGPDCRVVMDGVPEEAPTRDAILSAASVLRLDAREAELLAGRPIPDQAAAQDVAAELLERGPRRVVMAVGNEGNLFCTRDDAVLLPLVDDGLVVDTTGGGDAFVATLAWALHRGVGWVRAGRLATAAAGLVVRHPGGRPALERTAVEESADRLTTPDE